MNLDLTPEQSAFRDEVRAFFAENVPESFKSRVRAGMRLEPHEFTQWQKLLHARGWGAPSWPKEYGGTGWDPTQLYIFETEASRADAPVQFHQGLELIGPIIFTFGSPEQKAKYLPAIVSGDDWWCQGYSEPNSGSDLASLSTRAVRDGNEYVINGQKAWTSYAHVANRMFLLARTDPDARKQAGISLFLIDIDTPGVTIRPVVTMDEIHHTNEVFLDNVRVPPSALLGEEGMGWSYGKVLLDRERGVTAATTTRLAQQQSGLRVDVHKHDFHRSHIGLVALGDFANTVVDDFQTGGQIAHFLAGGLDHATGHVLQFRARHVEHAKAGGLQARVNAQNAQGGRCGLGQTAHGSTTSFMRAMMVSARLAR